jgi:elongation factor G
MSNTDISRIRNVAIVAHSGAGKTSLVESMLYDAGAIDRTGRVEDGNTVMDFEQEEIDRQIASLRPLHIARITDTRSILSILPDLSTSLRIQGDV